MMDANIHSRIFIVGAGRSGTTLLQSIIGAHPAVHTFPESHFFCGLFPHPFKRYLRLPSRRWKDRFSTFANEINRANATLPSHFRAISSGKVIAREFIAFLDELTLECQKTVWVEKTPNHISFIRVIRSYCPGAKFIHIIRPGLDVVASLVDVTQRYPDQWGGPWSIDKCIGHWNRAVRKQKKWLGKPSHMMVYYPELVENPRAIAEQMCKFIGVTYNSSMLDNRHSKSSAIMTDKEKWKEGVKSEIKKPANRSSLMFDEKTTQYINSKLLSWPNIKWGTP